MLSSIHGSWATLHNLEGLEQLCVCLLRGRGVLPSVPGKVFARIILYRVRHHLPEHQCPEQSGFTPKRSTIDCILTLRVFTECRREFQQGLLAIYVDLCKVFYSVNRDALWRILGFRRVPPKLINLMSELYSGTESTVRCGGTISDFFQLLLEFIRVVYWPSCF